MCQVGRGNSGITRMKLKRPVKAQKKNDLVPVDEQNMFLPFLQEITTEILRLCDAKRKQFCLQRITPTARAFDGMEKQRSLSCNKKIILKYLKSTDSFTIMGTLARVILIFLVAAWRSSQYPILCDLMYRKWLHYYSNKRNGRNGKKCLKTDFIVYSWRRVHVLHLLLFDLGKGILIKLVVLLKTGDGDDKFYAKVLHSISSRLRSFVYNGILCWRYYRNHLW